MVALDRFTLNVGQGFHQGVSLADRVAEVLDELDDNSDSDSDPESCEDDEDDIADDEDEHIELALVRSSSNRSALFEPISPQSSNPSKGPNHTSSETADLKQLLVVADSASISEVESEPSSRTEKHTSSSWQFQLNLNHPSSGSRPEGFHTDSSKTLSTPHTDPTQSWDWKHFSEASENDSQAFGVQAQPMAIAAH